MAANEKRAVTIELRGRDIICRFEPATMRMTVQHRKEETQPPHLRPVPLWHLVFQESVFDNGCRVLVNFSGKTMKLDDVLVPAHDAVIND